MTQIILKPRNATSGTTPRSTTINLERETSTDWYGAPIDNPKCPVLQYPKHAWECAGHGAPWENMREVRPYVIWVFASRQEVKGKGKRAKTVTMDYAYCLWNPEQHYQEARLPSAGSFLWPGAPAARRAALDVLMLPETRQVSISMNQSKRIATLYKQDLAKYLGQMTLPLAA